MVSLSYSSAILGPPPVIFIPTTPSFHFFLLFFPGLSGCSFSISFLDFFPDHRMRDFLKILITLSLIPFLNGTFYILDSVIKKKGGGELDIKIKEIRGRENTYYESS